VAVLPSPFDRAAVGWWSEGPPGDRPRHGPSPAPGGRGVRHARPAASLDV